MHHFTVIMPVRAEDDLRWSDRCAFVRAECDMTAQLAAIDHWHSLGLEVGTSVWLLRGSRVEEDLLEDLQATG
jgi:hypothetical protein